MRAPYGVGRNGQIFPASPVYKGHWGAFLQVAKAAFDGKYGIGFVLTEDCGYTVIDLDVKDEYTHPNEPEKWTTREQIERYFRIVEEFDSYTEISAGGKGLHIWVKGSIGPGCRRDGVEIYSRERFIVCTGSVYKDKPIMERQELLDILSAEMRTKGDSRGCSLVEVESELEDIEVYERASKAINGDKFEMLCNGKWYELGYPSQSEADLSLMSMLAFYSPSNEQCKRLFKMSALGQREKADERYLNMTLRLIRSRMERENILHANFSVMAEDLVKRVAAMELDEQHRDGQAIALKQRNLTFPPGLAGKIAQYLFDSAVRPVPEVAIAATIGLLAGICGKPFNVSGTGLNLYIVLVARSAIGKESLHTGISNLMACVIEGVPGAGNFVDFSEYSSGQAVSKAIIENPCFVNVSGELGRKFRRLASEEYREGPMSSYRTALTHLYMKSGQSSVFGGLKYSDKEKNTASVYGAAYSLVGETTPETYFASLTDSMMEDGFLSRFITIDCDSDRPPANKTPLTRPDADLLEKICQLCEQSLNLMNRQQYQDVSIEPKAQEALDKFDKECDSIINVTDQESFRQMWNRAHLKVLRLSALLAVADNHLHPKIMTYHVDWALNTVRRDIEMVRSKMVHGDIGNNDAAADRKLLQILREYLTKTVSIGIQIPESMKEIGVIPYIYISTRAKTYGVFKNSIKGTTNAIRTSIATAVDLGILVEVGKAELAERGLTGRWYRILSLPVDL